jgi:hypothetical protein
LKRVLLILFIIISVATLSESKAQSRTASIASQVVRSYPNPATSFVTFDFQQDYKSLSIQIYNFLGKKMFESAALNQRTVLNLSDYTRGVYIYQLRDRSGKMIESGKFQVSK